MQHPHRPAGSQRRLKLRPLAVLRANGHPRWIPATGNRRALLMRGDSDFVLGLPARAKALLAEAGLAAGSETTPSYELSTASVDEPVALFMQDEMASVGIKAAIDKRKPGQVRRLIGRRELPLYVFQFAAWFDSIEYFFLLLYNGSNTSPSNGPGYDDPAFNAVIAAALPHELSGGMCQRVMIAIAMAASPRLLIADEPTTGLDVTTQAAIMALLLTTRDLALAGEYCDRVAVMHAGHLVEDGPLVPCSNALCIPTRAGWSRRRRRARPTSVRCSRSQARCRFQKGRCRPADMPPAALAT